MCGGGDFNQAKWQANTGPAVGLPQGFYSGAVNNILFQGGSGTPVCGQTCGQCYDLITTGVNAYNEGIAGGSPITMMVVDACYNNNGEPNWCKASGQDDFGCQYHFDVDTDPTRGDVPVVGMDGTTWQREFLLRPFLDVFGFVEYVLSG